MALKMWRKLPCNNLNALKESVHKWRLHTGLQASHCVERAGTVSPICIFHAKFHKCSLRTEKKNLAVKDPDNQNPEIETDTQRNVQVQSRRAKIVPVPHIKKHSPVKEEEEYELPSHDEKRKTQQNRDLELKASSMFEELAVRRGATKEMFIMATKQYVRKESLYRRGAVEFITSGMKEMQRFKVERDLDAYKALLEVLPEEKMIPRNAWQVEFMHYPRQQQCIIDMLEMMETNALIPDDKFGDMLKNRFGDEAHVTRKYRRMMYWLPKFKNMNPYPIPYDMPVDPIELALLALKRMSVDLETTFKVWKTVDLEEEPEEDTFVASAQSLNQHKLIQNHKTDDPLFVEGPFPVYLRKVRQNYFLLRAEANVEKLRKHKEKLQQEEDDENLCDWKNFFEEEHYTELQPILSCHEQEDGTVLALCITGSGSKSSVMRWIHCLQQYNPTLAKTPVLFQLGQMDNQLEPTKQGMEGAGS